MSHRLSRLALIGVVAAGALAASAVPAFADDSEDVDLTIDVVAPASGGALTLTYDPVEPPSYALIDGQSGEPGTLIEGYLGKVTITDTTYMGGLGTGWDLSLAFAAPFTLGAYSIPMTQLRTIGGAWDGAYQGSYTAAGVTWTDSSADSLGRPLASALQSVIAATYDLDAEFELSVPADAPLGAYTTTVTIDLVGG